MITCILASNVSLQRNAPQTKAEQTFPSAFPGELGGVCSAFQHLRWSLNRAFFFGRHMESGVKKVDKEIENSESSNWVVVLLSIQVNLGMSTIV